MPKQQEIVKRRSEYLGTGQPSLRDSVIAKMLDLAGQIHRQEVLPAEIRFWAQEFKNVSPELLEWAFREQLRTGKFFPKPADITELIERRRLAARANMYTPIDRASVEAEQATAEWESAAKQAREALRKLAGLSKFPSPGKAVK